MRKALQIVIMALIVLLTIGCYVQTRRFSYPVNIIKGGKVVNEGWAEEGFQKRSLFKPEAWPKMDKPIPPATLVPDDTVTQVLWVK